MADEPSATRSLPRSSFGSDADYDDVLGMPESEAARDGPVDNQDGGEARAGEKPATLHLNRYHGNGDVFLPDRDVTVTFDGYERDVTTHVLSPNLYTIRVTHARFEWTVRRRYKDVQRLHQDLVLFRTGLNLPLSSGRRKSGKGARKTALPRFPMKPELLVAYERIPHRMRQLEDYLNNVLASAVYRNHAATLNFLETSRVSFVGELGGKGKEGVVKKKSGSTHPGQTGCNCFGCFGCFCCLRLQICYDRLSCARWLSRWLFLKETCFGYLNPESGALGCVVLFDQGFEVATRASRNPLSTSWHVQTATRTLTFRAGTKRKRAEWIEAFRSAQAGAARDFVLANPRRSFAPIRSNAPVTWYVDGCDYMTAVADALEAAKEEIYITDWWLSPEIYLKRPALVGDYWRLDRVLERKAIAGVMVYVLLYKEVELALGLNSFYSKQQLQTRHKNIKVLRHPDHAKAGVFFWAHHEKLVIVDQRAAFLGGIDLCYGRWDDRQHRLTDLGSATPAVPDVATARRKTSTRPNGDVIWPIPEPYYRRAQAPEPSRPREGATEPAAQLEPGDQLLVGPGCARKPNTPETERKSVFRDISDRVRSKGKELIGLVYVPGENPPNVPDTDLDDAASVDSPEIDCLNGSAKYWVGKDYVNFIVKDFTKLDSPFDDFIDRATTPRMPWHDVGVCVEGAAARDVARHFVQRWNCTKLEKAKNNAAYPYLLPKSYGGDVAEPPSNRLTADRTHNVTCQVLRSLSAWSGGYLDSNHVEQSIHEAYIDTIARAQHYVYIENQFFISLSIDNPSTRNQVGEALFNRIMRAFKEKKTFRVYVVLPLLPGFEGEVGAETGTALHAITHWNYASISSGKDAILNRLKKAGIPDPSDYITFYGLRTHARLNSEPITELIYVHSKLMLVDDKMAICGSANVNDRSLIGKRDSEIAVVVEDETFEDGVMDGRPYPCGKFVGGLRKYLFREHLGLSEGDNDVFDVDDPVSEDFYRNVWWSTASLNTEFYEKVFHCLPSDRVETFADIKRHGDAKPLWVDELSKAEKMLESIQGHLVLLPLRFLGKEDLTPGAATVEGILPTSLWT